VELWEFLKALKEFSPDFGAVHADAGADTQHKIY
jgi:hypothetical protein